MYPIADPIDSVSATSVDQSGQGNNFIGLPYLPYFSNCKGSDSYLFLDKMMETDPRCTLVDYDNTVYVSPYPWTGLTTPNSDQCNTTVPAAMQNKQIGNTTVPWLGNYAGALFDCVFEEAIAVPLTNPRWYEVPGGTTLWYIGTDPFPLSAYQPMTSTTSNKRESNKNLEISQSFKPNLNIRKTSSNIIGPYTLNSKP